MICAKPGRLELARLVKGDEGLLNQLCRIMDAVGETNANPVIAGGTAEACFCGLKDGPFCEDMLADCGLLAIHGFPPAHVSNNSPKCFHKSRKKINPA